MSERKTKDAFIKDAMSIHGKKYDYSKVNYTNCHTKVCIICPIHGEFWQRPNDHLSKKQGCPYCGGTAKLSTNDFVEKCKNIHNNKYDYSLVCYVNNKVKVKIICPKHGIFEQTPDMHMKGSGCPKCKTEKARKKLFNRGYYDCSTPITDKDNYNVYNIWRAMFNRCYSDSVHKKQPSYIGCSVCEEWYSFNNFKSFWNKNNPMRFCLDKDILFKGNKMYSPQTCCFVPNDINILFSKKKRTTGLPVGVKYAKGNKFSAYINTNHKDKYLGCYSTPKEAFQAYKKAKEAWIKEVANKWKDKLAPNVYEALMKYEVEITD